VPALEKEAEQLPLLQEMPDGELVTAPEPVTDTVRVRVLAVLAPLLTGGEEASPPPPPPPPLPPQPERAIAKRATNIRDIKMSKPVRFKKVV